MEPHSIWQDEIKKRNAELSSDWWPFAENVNDILERINLLTQRMDSLDNEIGETKGMIKNLRKVLIKLEVVDDRFVF
jgi:peptidoglycan hydrolase CwlO-like protein